MKKILISLLFLFAFSSQAAQIEPKNIISDFFSSIIKGDVSVAYDKLFSGSSIPADKPQAVNLLKQQTKNGLSLYGKILGYEFISEEKFGKSILRYVYILKLEKGPVVWVFYFYKPKDKWILANVTFNDQLDLLR